MKNALEKVVEKIKTHVLPSITFFPEDRALCEITWKNIVEPDSPQITIWCMDITCCVPKATDIHLEYVIPIAFPPQQWLQERASILRYTHVACPVCSHLLTDARVAHAYDTVCCGTPFENC